MVLHRIHTPTLGNYMLPKSDVECDLINWSVKIGIAETSDGYAVDNLSGVVKTPEVLNYSGHRRLNSSEDVYDVIKETELWKLEIVTLYRGWVDWRDSSTLHDEQSIEAIVKSCYAKARVPRRSDLYKVDFRFSFELTGDFWS